MTLQNLEFYIFVWFLEAILKKKKKSVILQEKNYFEYNIINFIT